ncbi:MAG: hypothetical protein JXB43_09195 [Dehalococcoidia bacterium]|nr:hypothetical protein [Dehalococcoidia bacterium]
MNGLEVVKLKDISKKILKYFVFVAVPVALVIGAAYVLQPDAERGDTMALKGTIPPIDAAVPAQAETATFSLG